MQLTHLQIERNCLALFCAPVAVIMLYAPDGDASASPTRGTSAREVESSPDAYRLAPEPLQVETALFDLHDDARAKDLPLKGYTPSRGGPYPVIIFSHGAGGSRDVAPTLLGHWASYGYVVIAPSHGDSVQLVGPRVQTDPSRDREGLARASAVPSGAEQSSAHQMDNILRSFGTDPQVRIGRVEDIALILDKLSELPKLAPHLKGKIDAQHIGLGGHSAGAMTASLVGGATVDMLINGAGGPETRSFRDQRIEALILLSGQGVTGPGGGFHKGSWQAMDLPVMVQSGSYDNSPRTRQTAASRRHPYEYAPPGDKYLVFIDGALHMSFTGRAANEEPGLAAKWIEQYMGTPDFEVAMDYDQRAIYAYVKMSTLAFWDAYLKDDAKAKTWLNSDKLTQLSRGQVEYQFK